MSKCFNGAVEVDCETARVAWRWWQRNRSGAEKWVVDTFNQAEAEWKSTLTWWDKFKGGCSFRRYFTGDSYASMGVTLIAAGVCTAEELNEKFGWEKYVPTIGSYKGVTLYRERWLDEHMETIGSLTSLATPTILATPDQADAIYLLLSGKNRYDHPF